ncbi:MAG TPA: dehydrogenase [Gammaproteobacteria bacterium]|nr:dehydrogenase [Gammaproteobacteria bacterium]
MLNRIILAVFSVTFSFSVSAKLCSEQTNQNYNDTAKILASGWGFTPTNTRYLDSDTVAIDKDSVSKLTLKWAFRFPRANKARSQPAITEDTIFVGSQKGKLYALDRETGCIRWQYKTSDGFGISPEIRTAISIGYAGAGGERLLFFGDFFGNAHAVRAATGERVWKTSLDDHIAATITGSPTLHNGILYVPVSSFEVALPAIPFYSCCKFRGSVAALDAKSGEIIWQQYVSEAPTKQGRNKLFVSQYGPSGAPIWNSPTIDEKRGLLYVGTGENYSHPATNTSDAILAMDLKNGEMKWVFQATSNDAWNFGCALPGAINCPENPGLDLDFGASPLLATLANGKDMIFAGQKNGVVYALDPDNGGQLIWQKRVGRGGALGGIHWGLTFDGERLYVPVSDYLQEIPGLNAPLPEDPSMSKVPGLYALSPTDGSVLWETPSLPICENREECDPGLSAAPSAIPGVIFSGALDGHLRAYDAVNGKVLWQVDTTAEVPTTDGKIGKGGSLDADGPVIVGNQLYVNSGYKIFGEKAGNVFLVYSTNEN